MSERTFVRMFQPQFKELITTGKKTQTIRKIPKTMPKPGDRISCRKWIDKPYRSKQEILGDFEIKSVSRIYLRSHSVSFDDGWLGYGGRNDLAVADGFKDYSEMWKWFRKIHDEETFQGILIKWEFENE